MVYGENTYVLILRSNTTAQHQFSNKDYIYIFYQFQPVYKKATKHLFTTEHKELMCVRSYELFLLSKVKCNLLYLCLP
jgi:hypothetical protein